MKNLILIACLALSACASQPKGEWPAEVVSFDRMETRKPLDMWYSASRALGIPVARVSCLLWVDEAGRVLQVRLLEESGSRELDGAVMRAAREMRFEPWVVDGVARPVSVVMPVNFDKRVEPRRKGEPDIVPGFRMPLPEAL